MSPKEALSILDQATQPNVQIPRSGYVAIEQALRVIKEIIDPAPKPEPPTAPKE